MLTDSSRVVDHYLGKEPSIDTPASYKVAKPGISRTKSVVPGRVPWALFQY